MNLKTAFRYQNFLTSLSSDASCMLARVKVTQTELHQKSLAIPELTDEELTVENTDIDNGFSANACIKLILDIFEEKSKLDKAIAAAKKAADFDFDAELNTNKYRRTLIDRLALYASAHDSEKKTMGSDYKFNAEGNQTSYSYPVKVKTVLNYDKEKLAEDVNKLATEADEISDKADAFLLETDFEFEPKFNIRDTFERIVKEY